MKYDGEIEKEHILECLTAVEGIQKLDVPTLKIIIDNILEYENLEQVKKYIH